MELRHRDRRPVLAGAKLQGEFGDQAIVAAAARIQEQDGRAGLSSINAPLSAPIDAAQPRRDHERLGLERGDNRDLQARFRCNCSMEPCRARSLN